MPLRNKLPWLCFWALLFIGVTIRAWVSLHFQTRAWIDEMTVVLNPAFKLAFGAGKLQGQTDWLMGTRDWFAPLILAGYLKILSIIGIQKGIVVLPLVSLTIQLFSIAGLFYFCFFLKKIFSLTTAPILPLLILFFVPEFIHFGHTADLSALGLPWLIFGLGLVLTSLGHGNTLLLSRSPTKLGLSLRSASYLGWICLNLASLIRFQYAVFPFSIFLWLLLKKQWQKCLYFMIITCAVFIFDLLLNSWLYGYWNLPLLTYFKANVFDAVAASYGVSPFYVAFEYLWRFVTEPVFALIVFTFAFAYKRVGVLHISTTVFFFIHMVVGHKEYRFYYGPAVLFAGISAAALQAWLEQKHKEHIALFLFLLSFVIVASYRATKKVHWADYQYPAKLETYAGSQPDFQGLITYGWGGIYSGGHYTTYNTKPYLFAETLTQLRQIFIRDNMRVSHVITGSNEPAPCRTVIRTEGGASLYRCSTEEIRVLTLDQFGQKRSSR